MANVNMVPGPGTTPHKPPPERARELALHHALWFCRDLEGTSGERAKASVAVAREFEKYLMDG